MPRANIETQRTVGPRLSRSTVPSHGPSGEADAERHRVEPHVGAAEGGRRDVGDVRREAREEDHLPERPDDGPEDDGGEASRKSIEAEAGGDEERPGEERPAVGNSGRREVQRHLEKDDEKRVEREEEAERRRAPAEVADEEERERCDVLEKDDDDGQRGRQEVEVATVGEGCQEVISRRLRRRLRRSGGGGADRPEDEDEAGDKGRRAVDPEEGGEGDRREETAGRRADAHPEVDGEAEERERGLPLLARDDVRCE